MSEKSPTIKKPKKRFHKTRKVSGFSVKLFLEIFLICLMLIILAAGALIYKLSKNDLDVAFAKNHLETTINKQIAPYHIKTGRLDIEWLNIFDRPIFRIADLTFLNEQDEALLTLEDLSFTLSRTDLFLGGIVPRKIIAKGLDLHIVRRQDDVVQLGFVAGPSFILYDPQIEKQSPDFNSFSSIYGTYLAQMLEEGFFFKGLKTLQIRNSAIVFENIAKDYALSFPNIDAVLRPTDQKLNLNVNMQVQNGSNRDNLSFYNSYDIKFKELETLATTENFNPFLWANFFNFNQFDAEKSHIKIDSQIQMTFDDYFNLLGADITTNSSEGRLDIPALYDRPFEFSALALNGFFNRKNLTFDLRDSVLDAYGIKVLIDGNVPIYSEDITQYDVPLFFKIEEFAVPIQEDIFPKQLKVKPIYKWLTDKLKTGRIINTEMALDVSFNKEGEEWKANREKLLGSFDFENLTADYKAPMVPMSNISGHAIVDSGPDHMLITTDSGNFGNLAIKDMKIEVTDLLAVKKSTVDLDFNLAGSFKDLFFFLSKDPINIAQKVAFDIQDVEGSADLNIRFRAQTKKDLPLEDIFLEVDGRIAEMFIPKLVKGLDVRSEDVTFTIKDKLISAKGTTRILESDVSYVWQQYMKGKDQPFKMKLDADLMANAGIQKHFGINISEFLSGTPTANITYVSQSDKSALIDVSADLTPAQIHIDTLGYLKPAGDAAKASLKIEMQDQIVQSINALNIFAPNLSISNGDLNFVKGKISKGSFKNAKIGSTEASFSLDYANPKSLTLNISGKTLDARAFLSPDKEKKEYKGPEIRSSINVNNLITHESLGIKQAKIFFNLLEDGNIFQFEMDGKSGEGDVYVRYKPDQNGSPNLRAEFMDAGAALRAFGLNQNVRGGKMTITGTSADRIWEGNVTGSFLLQNFSVRKMPVLAKLINSMSLPGLGQLISNDGVVFSKLSSTFVWNTRPEGALITVRDGRTSGSELGLTFEGLIDRATKTINMEGTIVPVSTLNNLIGDIPLLGPIITGGTGSLIAATYKIKGPYHDAEVRINPLSALAPGIIRKILFED